MFKADQSTTYTKTETDTKLNFQADKTTTNAKTEVDNNLSNKQNALIFHIPTSGVSLTNDGVVVKSFAASSPLVTTDSNDTITFGLGPITNLQVKKYQF